MAKKVKGIFISEKDFEILLNDMDVVVNHAKSLSSLFPGESNSPALLSNLLEVNLAIIRLGLQCRYNNYKNNG